MKTSIARSLVTGALFVVPAFLLVPLGSVSVSMQGLQFSWSELRAQEDGEERRQTRRAMAVSESVNRSLARVSEHLSPEGEGAEPNLQAALQEANNINHSRWNDFERAQLYNLYGNIYVQLENYNEAIKYFQMYVDTPSIPEPNMLNVSYYLAQLYLATENYPEAIRLLEQYIQRSEIVGADHYYRLGQAYYMAENLAKALPNIEKAVRLYEESDRVPPEGLYQYQMSLHYGREDYPKVITVLEKLVRHYPKISHWRTLAQVYGVSGRQLDQLHAFDTIYMMGGLEQEKELRLLGSLYLEQEYPYKGAKILQKGIDDKKIEDTSRNLELLAGAWSMAREQDKSIPVMEQAAAKSDDGELYARLSQLYLSIDEHQKAIDAGREALKRELKKPANVHLYIGMSLYNQEKYDAALSAFREARKDKNAARQANTWIRLVESEKERMARLREGDTA
ncbi:MAG: tetratricopeptide repeat protein [Cellvibrionaceae bacterium]